jgi:hypothetical protein
MPFIPPSNRPRGPRAARYFLTPSATVTADTAFDLEIPSTVAGDGFPSAEFSGAAAAVPGVWIAPPNRRGAPRAARYFLAESATFTVTADAMLALEGLGAQRSDLPVPIESLARALCDLPAQSEYQNWFRLLLLNLLMLTNGSAQSEYQNWFRLLLLNLLTLTDSS